MKLATEIPDDWHADICGDPADIVTVTPEQDAVIQIAMIRTHAVVNGFSDLQEAAVHWCQTGLAAAYRQHYRRVIHA